VISPYNAKRISDVRRVMSKSSKRSVNMAIAEYRGSFQQSIKRIGSLIDRGANGFVASEDVRLIFKTNRSVDIKGIDNHHVNDIGIGNVGGVVQTHRGLVIAIMHQYALLGKGASIYSPAQMEWYKNDINDKLIHVTGRLQQTKTFKGYIISLSNHLAYFQRQDGSGFEDIIGQCVLGAHYSKDTSIAMLWKLMIFKQ
jgi:hypothetical protein